MEQALSVATFSNGEEDKRLVEGNNVGDKDIILYNNVIGCADRGESGNW